MRGSAAEGVEEKMGNLPSWHFMGAQVSDAASLREVQRQFTLIQAKMRCFFSAMERRHVLTCSHPIKYGQIRHSYSLGVKRQAGNLLPCFFFLHLKDSFKMLTSTGAFCILKTQSIQVVLKCSGERVFSFELSRTLDLCDLTTKNLLGSEFSYRTLKCSASQTLSFQ